MKAILALLFIVLINVAFADVYMHNPRGSNNRNCERNDNRNNNNRLFDSQNNAAGGYACPRAVGGPDVVTKTMYYYGGSKLQIEWTNQHSCGQENNNCEIVLQYMCENDQPGIRDGTPSDINDSATDGLTVSNKDDARTGQHETYEYYRRCQTRHRNGALYLGATQLSTTASATQTRQNPNGGKSGWECPEERDYYPYFHPTPWRDIAVLTTNISRCAYYKANSENVVGRGECWSQDFTSYLPWNNPNECLLNNGVWNTTQPNGDPAPDCVQAPWSRDNHLGNGANGYQNNYIWTIPNINRNTCVLRLRYNISTAETPWTADKKNNAAPLTKQDAVIDSGYGHPLQYAMNNNQYGRTFEDRSYVFSIRPRPTEISPQSTIWNLNVRGKRGNIVDTFPSTEYDFVPQVLVVNGDDYIHFQWTGSDYNPNRQPNNGEGGPLDPADGASARADRSNLVQMSLSAQNVPRKLSDQTMFVYDNGTQNDDIAKLLALLDQPGLTSTDPSVMCLNYTTLLAKNNNNANSAKLDKQNCMKLGNAPTPYFDAGLVKMHATGRFAYVCTRNNNFSNRSQKGLIIVGGAKFSNSPRNGSSLLLVAIVFIASLLF